MTIPELLQERATQYADSPFLIFDDQQHSYQEIHENACRVAANLARRGVGKGDKLLLIMRNCPEFVYLFLGAGRIGAVVVPINPMLKPDEIAYIASNSDSTTVITIPELVPLMPNLMKEAPTIRQVFVLSNKPVNDVEPFSTLLEPTESIPESVATERDDAALIYTSGTTGAPKGVILTHRNYIWNARMISRAADFTSNDRFLCVLPVFHVNAQVVTLLTPLLLGASVVLMGKFNAFGILPLITRYRVTCMSAVPTIYNVLCNVYRPGEHDVSSIRLFATGAAPLPEETYLNTQRILKRPVVNGYGLSEATCASAVGDIRDPIQWNSVGTPLPYTNIRIVDADGADQPVGSIGEIVISGPSVMEGYYKNPEATKEVLRGGWLHTGDLGRFDENGYLYIVGRIKDMIIRGGQNVYPAQIESVISKIPGIEEACVVGVEEARWGQEILAAVKLAEGVTMTEKEVIDYCRQNLAQYKCPRFVKFVEELPKTATGKIRKNVVADQFADIAKVS